MLILAIDTSCDETSASVVNNDCILSNVISSQVDLHKKWGGVVPDIARRAHRENIDSVVNEALMRARVSLEQIDYFAATFGPGLAIALRVGLDKGKGLAKKYNKPFIPVNHMEGHLLSSFAKNSRGKSPGGVSGPTKNDFPAIGMLISGGHTQMVYVKNFGDYELLGETLDDAAGEAFDKVAKMLDLGYPGGPIVSEFAKKGMAGRFDLPIPMEKSGNLNFSYSGLKTACLYKLKSITAESPNMPKTDWVYDFCADFVNSVIKSIVIKLEKAVDEYNAKSVLLGGGVISNVELRRKIRSAMKKKDVIVFQPYHKRLFTDNAGMIGIAGYYMVKRNDKSIVTGNDIDGVDLDPVAQIG
ncbi:MAG: tRNA (adenosine(37)-N6)-threonylcarbamoyltransferase complex transferase subunit TsaD [Patescibacteria group bacterium]|nr:tRNA (adenosine(37)-N6)-threonylcarbamoyltransferase complex transferase subunit TsaD [Patescibacteria group bacterium]